jgi:ABC-2 type transport system permease protein
MTIFVAVQAPELVSRDLRSHVLPLYLSRPLRRLDYPLAKYAAFTIACLLVLEIPLVLLYLGTLVSATGGSMVWGETRALAAGAGLAVLWALLLAGIGLLLASLTGRRAFATGGIAIVFFLSWTVAGLISALLGSSAGALLSPFTVLDEVRQWLGGGPVPGGTPAPGGAGPLFGVMFAALLAASLAALAARYRRVGAA